MSEDSETYMLIEPGKCLFVISGHIDAFGARCKIESAEKGGHELLFQENDKTWHKIGSFNYDKAANIIILNVQGKDLKLNYVGKNI